MMRTMDKFVVVEEDEALAGQGRSRGILNA